MKNTFKIKALFMLQKINILTAFFVLLAGIVIIAGCSSPQGGDTKNEQVIEQPTNGGKTEEQEQQPENNGQGNQGQENEQGNDNENQQDNENTGNNEQGNDNENTGNNEQGNDNENQQGNENTGNNEQGNDDENQSTGNDNENTDNNEQGNNNENTGNENQQQEVVYGGEPYDKAIGNGNYILHNFIGENTSFTEDTVVAGTNHYLGKAETYLKGLANSWNESMQDRPAAQNYFGDLITAVQNDSFYINENYPSGQTFDTAVNKISRNASTYFADIIKNLDNEDDRYAFYAAYCILANESYKEGLGSYRQYSSPQMDEYEEEKNFLIELANANKLDGGPFVNVDIEQDYTTNNFAQTTNIVDTMIDTAVNNMNNNRNLDLQASDLRQLINLGITTNSLEGMHDYTKGNLHHTMCEMGNNIVSTMSTAMTEAEQSQTMGL